MHRVFVYGSLMHGYHNHRLLATARFLRRDRTAHYHFRMFSFRAYPAVVAVAGPESGPVEGELYEVDGDTLAALDRLEGHPHVYERSLVALEGGGHASMYLYRAAIRGEGQVVGNDWRTEKPAPGYERCPVCGGHGVGEEPEPGVGYDVCHECNGHGHVSAEEYAAFRSGEPVTDLF